MAMRKSRKLRQGQTGLLDIKQVTDDDTPPVSPTKFTPNAEFRTMEYELTPTGQKFISGVILCILFPLFIFMVIVALAIRLGERLFATSFLRDLYHDIHSSVTLVSGPVSNGPKLPAHPPFIELIEFEIIKTPWFIFRIVVGSVLLVLKGGLTCAKIRILSDSEFGDYINKSLFSQYLVKEKRDGETIYTLTLDEIVGLETWTGTFLSGSVTIFKRTREGKLIPVSITLENGCTFYPRTSPEWKWALSKVFVMQGLVYVTIVGRHPHLHFPYDTINVVTKRHLHPTHPLYKLLAPHFRFSMVLNITVLSAPNSVLFSDYWKPYAALTLDSSEIFNKLMHRGWAKWSFPRYPNLSEEFVYGYSLLNYYQCIRRFIAQISPYIPRDDFVLQWGNEIAKNLPSFPSGEDLVKDETLFIDTLAMIIFTVSVHHCADHYCFSHMDHRVLPFRLRVPPPSDHSTAIGLNENELMTRLDYLKQVQFHVTAAFPGKCYFPLIVDDTALAKVDYKFNHPEMTRAQESFKLDLILTNKSLEKQVGPVVPLDELVCSIEF
ncbi:lipoxygenase [Paraphysoderma sedebokerense]|nr:lipoxygenase [Paraphysoderma sedebokerense]